MIRLHADLVDAVRDSGQIPAADFLKVVSRLSFFVNAGIYVLNHDIVDKVQSGQCVDMPNLLTDQIALGDQVSMFPVHEYWLDIGKKEDFEQAQIDYPRDFA